MQMREETDFFREKQVVRVCTHARVRVLVVHVWACVCVIACVCVCVCVCVRGKLIKRKALVSANVHY